MLPYLHLGALQIPMYGLCILVGVALATGLAMYRAKKTSISPDDILYAVTYTVLGGMLGGKLLFVLTSWDYIMSRSSYFFGSLAGFREFFSYGFVFYGALIGGLAVLIPYTLKHKLNLGDMICLCIPCIPVAHAIGRLGCFCAGCCYGIPMDPPWGVYFNSPLAPQGVSLFPVQLLESALNLILFAVLFTYARKPRKPGAVLGGYLVGYGVERFLLEYLRYDEVRGFFLGVSTSQWISLILVPIGLALILLQFEEKIGLPALAGPGSFVPQEEAEETAEPAAEEGPAEEITEKTAEEPADETQEEEHA